MKAMTPAERLAAKWLAQRYHCTEADLRFNSHVSPDFIVPSGEGYEVKQPNGHGIFFGRSQLFTLCRFAETANCFVLVFDHTETPKVIAQVTRDIKNPIVGLEPYFIAEAEPRRGKFSKYKVKQIKHHWQIEVLLNPDGSDPSGTKAPRQMRVDPAVWRMLKMIAILETVEVGDLIESMLRDRLKDCHPLLLSDFQDMLGELPIRQSTDTNDEVSHADIRV